MTTDNSENETNETSGISRRRFLKVAGGTVAGAAGLVALGGPGAGGTGSAAPGGVPGSGKVLDTFTYKGQTLQMVELDEQTMLRMNGQVLPDHVFTKTENGFASHLLPFEDHRDGRALARKLIDNNGVLFVLSGVGGAQHH